MRKRKLVLGIFIAICLTVLGLIGILSLKNKSSPEIDKYATKIENQTEPVDESEDIGSDDSEQSAIVVCAQNMSIDLQSKKVSLFYQNPDNSKSNIKLELYIDDKLVAMSDCIPAGYELDSMDIITPIKAEDGVYQGFLKTIFIDPENSEEQDLNSGINVLVNIKNLQCVLYF